MRFLLDTNVLIPLEPQSADGQEALSPAVREFYRLAQTAHCEIWAHPGNRIDIERAPASDRRSLRLTQFEKYQVLPDPPEAEPEWLAEAGEPARGTNSWVDLYLLAAVKSPLVDYLVTEDQQLIRRAYRHGLEQAVLSISGALELVRGLFDTIPPVPPHVTYERVHQLDAGDPIFASLQLDYEGFPSWLNKCAREMRDVFVVRPAGGNMIAALVILKREDDALSSTHGKTLKLCTFKVSEDFRGYRYGELLLKQVFSFAIENDYSFAFVEVYEKHEQLIAMFDDFGFENAGRKASSSELILVKCFRPSAAAIAEHSPLDVNRLYGPAIFDRKRANVYVIPIVPRFHAALFPELESQQTFFESSTSYGNSIRKAYLCHSNTKQLKEGDLLLYYRSRISQGIQTLGVCESWIRSVDEKVIARFVGRRTVFPYEEIARMCTKPVLAILFRQALSFERVHLKELRTGGVVGGHPQSIARVAAQGQEWFWNRINLQS